MFVKIRFWSVVDGEKFIFPTAHEKVPTATPLICL